MIRRYWPVLVVAYLVANWLLAALLFGYVLPYLWGILAALEAGR